MARWTTTGRWKTTPHPEGDRGSPPPPKPEEPGDPILVFYEVTRMELEESLLLCAFNDLSFPCRRFQEEKHTSETEA